MQLQPKHQQLVLKLAMNAAAKAKNYASADDFARRLLDLSPPQDLQELVRTPHPSCLPAMC